MQVIMCFNMHVSLFRFIVKSSIHFMLRSFFTQERKKKVMNKQMYGQHNFLSYKSQVKSIITN